MLILVLWVIHCHLWQKRCVVCVSQLCSWLLWWPDGAWKLMSAMSVPWQQCRCPWPRSLWSSYRHLCVLYWAHWRPALWALSAWILRHCSDGWLPGLVSVFVLTVSVVCRHITCVIRKWALWYLSFFLLCLADSWPTLLIASRMRAVHMPVFRLLRTILSFFVLHGNMLHKWEWNFVWRSQPSPPSVHEWGRGPQNCEFYKILEYKHSQGRILWAIFTKFSGFMASSSEG